MSANASVVVAPVAVAPQPAQRTAKPKLNAQEFFKLASTPLVHSNAMGGASSDIPSGLLNYYSPKLAALAQAQKGTNIVDSSAELHGLLQALMRYMRDTEYQVPSIRDVKPGVDTIIKCLPSSSCAPATTYVLGAHVDKLVASDLLFWDKEMADAVDMMHRDNKTPRPLAHFMAHRIRGPSKDGHVIKRYLMNKSNNDLGGKVLKVLLATTMRGRAAPVMVTIPVENGQQQVSRKRSRKREAAELDSASEDEIENRGSSSSDEENGSGGSDSEEYEFESSDEEIVSKPAEKKIKTETK